jgi:AraC family transcriptional regulator of adaptative response / DNA-3-methyladenine glycosylase II
MRALGWPDAFPRTDYALRKVLGVSTVRAMQTRTAQWAPWRAYAAIHLWHRYEAMKSQGDGAVVPLAAMIPANSDIEVTT